MPESELTKRVIKAVKKADKLVQTIIKDTRKLLDVVREIKEIGQDGEEKGK